MIVIIAVAANGGGSKPNPATTPVNTVAAGPSQTTSAPPPATTTPAARTATVGDTVAFTDGDNAGTVTLNGVRSMSTPEGPIGQPPTHGTYLVANVTMTVSKGTMSANPLWFQASTTDGTTFTSELGVLNNQLPSEDVPAGRQVRGDVAFDVPRGQPLLLDFVFAGGSPLATFSVPAQ